MQNSQHQQLQVLTPFACSCRSSKRAVPRARRSWAPHPLGRRPPPSCCDGAPIRRQAAAAAPELAGGRRIRAQGGKKKGATGQLQPAREGADGHLRKERPSSRRQQGTGAENWCNKLHHGICFSHFTCTPLQPIAAVGTCAAQSQTPAASPSPCHSPGTADPCPVVSAAKKSTSFQLQLRQPGEPSFLLLPPQPPTALSSIPS